MKKVFIMTPMKLTPTVTSEKVNTYIRKVSGVIRAILDLEENEEIEFVTNFFLEPVGKDRDGEKIMQILNSDDEIAYMYDELSLIKDCDYIVMPELEGIGEGEYWSRLYGSLHCGNTWVNGRKLLFVPVWVNEPRYDGYGTCNKPYGRVRY